jgi:hypothetical protein
MVPSQVMQHRHFKLQKLYYIELCMGTNLELVGMATEGDFNYLNIITVFIWRN